MRCIVAAALSLSSAVAYAGVVDDGSCMYTRIVENKPYTFNLFGVPDVNFTDSVYNYTVQACGAISSTLCSPGWVLYTSHGSVIQQWTQDPPCTARSCIDYDTGDMVCCTGYCAVLSGAVNESGPVFGLKDTSSPKGGITLTWSAPPNNIDPFSCPYSPSTGLEVLRTAQLIVDCDASIAGFEIQGVDEVSACVYQISAAGSVGCPT